MSAPAEAHVFDNGVCVTCSPVVASFNPAELRDDHGKWTDGPGGGAANLAKDLLDLAERIDLDPRESLVSSGRIKDDRGDLDMNFAVIHSPAGNEVRVGIIPSEDSSKWRAADRGGTAVLDAGQVGKLRSDLTDATARAKKAARQADADPGSSDRVIQGLDPVAEGTIPNDWADVSWSVFLTDDDPASWETVIKAGDPEVSDGVLFEPRSMAALLKQMAGIESELADSPNAGPVTASSRTRLHELDNGICRTCN